MEAPRTRSFASRIRLLLSVLGPGIIAANADNDASGIFGYSLAGAQYQYSMLWVLLLSGFALAVMQEMGARMGTVTGKGLADLIREEYGVKITFFAMFAVLIANFCTTVSEFAGILAALELLGPKWVAVARFVMLPLLAAGVWFLISRGSYKKLERILLMSSVVYLLYVASALLAHPNWHDVGSQIVAPFKHIGPAAAYVLMLINVVGTTITPWGQFYIQSTVRDKGVKPKDYRLLKFDVYFGVIFTNIIGCFIIICCGAQLFTHGIHTLNDAGQAAHALTPLAGKLATVLFGIGLFNASAFGAVTVPLSTAYSITEAIGWESGMGRRIREAPLFVGGYTFLIVACALVVMLFPGHLGWLIILPNIVGGILLPIVLVLTLQIINKRRIMGKFKNSPVFNIVAWTTTTVLIILSVTLLISTLFPNLGGG